MEHDRIVVIGLLPVILLSFATCAVEEVCAMPQACSHLDAVKTDHRNTRGCEECLKMGDSWVHLRLCRQCGHVGCCDDSKNRHATKHFHATRHPIITSIEPGENWSWCYVDNVVLQV